MTIDPLDVDPIVDDPELVPDDEWDADRAFALTGDADDYSYLDELDE